MRRTLTSFIAAAVSLTAGYAASAQTSGTPAAKPSAPAAGPKAAAPAAMTAEQILDKAVEMSGGRAAYEKHSSLLMKGAFAIPSQNINGTIEIYNKTPNKSLVVVSIPGIFEQTEGFDGESAWSRDTMNGLRIKSGVELANSRRAATFNADLKWRELWKSVEIVGTDKVGDRSVYVVKFNPKDGEGNPQTNYYDAETFLLLRNDTVQTGPMGTIPVTALFSDYRDAGGIKSPYAIEHRSDLMTMKITFSEVTYDVGIEDAKFAKPQ